MMSPFPRCVTSGGIKVDEGTIVDMVPNVLFGECTSRVMCGTTNPEGIMVDGSNFERRLLERGGIPTYATHQIGDSSHASIAKLVGLVLGSQC